MYDINWSSFLLISYNSGLFPTCGSGLPGLQCNPPTSIWFGNIFVGVDKLKWELMSPRLWLRPISTKLGKSGNNLLNWEMGCAFQLNRVNSIFKYSVSIKLISRVIEELIFVYWIWFCSKNFTWIWTGTNDTKYLNTGRIWSITLLTKRVGRDIGISKLSTAWDVYAGLRLLPIESLCRWTCPAIDTDMKGFPCVNG